MNLSDKTGIPLGWAATIIVTVASVAFNAGISHYRIGNLEEELKSIERKGEEHLRLEADHELKLQRLDIGLDNIGKLLTSIDKRLERMERGR